MDWIREVRRFQHFRCPQRTPTDKEKGIELIYKFDLISIPDWKARLSSAYWSDTALIAPRKVFMAERSLKDLIFSGGYQ